MKLIDEKPLSGSVGQNDIDEKREGEINRGDKCPHWQMHQQKVNKNNWKIINWKGSN